VLGVSLTLLKKDSSRRCHRLGCEKPSNRSLHPEKPCGGWRCGGGAKRWKRREEECEHGGGAVFFNVFLCPAIDMAAKKSRDGVEKRPLSAQPLNDIFVARATSREIKDCSRVQKEKKRGPASKTLFDTALLYSLHERMFSSFSGGRSIFVRFRIHSVFNSRRIFRGRPARFVDCNAMRLLFLPCKRVNCELTSRSLLGRSSKFNDEVS